jgi:hypothetical protein
MHSVYVSSNGGTLAHHGHWTLQLSPLDRSEEGFEKGVESRKFEVKIWAYDEGCERGNFDEM